MKKYITLALLCAAMLTAFAGCVDTSLIGVPQTEPAFPAVTDNANAEGTPPIATMMPQRTDTLTIAGKEYTCLYYGKQDLRGTDISELYLEREYWLIEGAYEEVKFNATIGQVLPYSNYPMTIVPKQVYRVSYLNTDGFTETIYYRSDENYVWITEEYGSLPSTLGFLWES